MVCLRNTKKANAARGKKKSETRTKRWITVYIFEDLAKELGFYSQCEEKPQISYKTALAVREIRGQQSGGREIS